MCLCVFFIWAGVLVEIVSLSFKYNQVDRTWKLELLESLIWFVLLKLYLGTS